MRLKEVITDDQKKAFIKLPSKLYKNEPHWISPILKEIEEVFDPKKNRNYQHGECTRWILETENGDVIGRVAAFIDKTTVSKGNEQPTGGMGFFECIDDEKAAFILFDQCKSWLSERGMEAMDGPINFGNRDRWWGLLVDGFDRDVNFHNNYNFPYYRKFFEAYGFKLYFNQYTYGRSMYGALSERLTTKAKLVEEHGGYRFGFPDKLNLPELAQKMSTVYNRAWSNRREMPSLSTKQALLLLRQMKPILDLKLIWFGYYLDDPIAFFISIPEVNQIYRYVDGNLSLIGKLKALWHIKKKSCRKAFGLLFGIVPEHQGKGVDGAIIMAFRKLVQEEYRRYDEYELGWIGDFNPKMMKVAEQIEGDIVKTHTTYRYLFDPTKPYKRMRAL